MASLLWSLVIGTPLASASSFSQLDRQLRQKPARFIRSMFWTSVRERRCATRRRKAAASSSVLVLSSIVMTCFRCFLRHSASARRTRPDKRLPLLDGGLSQIFPYRDANSAADAVDWSGSGPNGPHAPSPVDDAAALTRNRQQFDIASWNDRKRIVSTRRIVQAQGRRIIAGHVVRRDVSLERLGRSRLPPVQQHLEPGRDCAWLQGRRGVDHGRLVERVLPKL